jgi:Tol biopolymer transport system component
MRPDGSDVRQLTSGAAAEIDYTFSPDGTRLAFVRHTASFGEGLYVVGVDGTGEQ